MSNLRDSILNVRNMATDVITVKNLLKTIKVIVLFCIITFFFVKKETFGLNCFSTIDNGVNYFLNRTIILDLQFSLN